MDCHDSRDLISTIIQSAADAIIVMDARGVVEMWNPRAVAMFGWSSEESIGRRVAQLIIPPHLRAQHEKGLRHLQETGDGPILNRVIEVPALHKDGRTFPVELSVVETRPGQVARYSAIIRDITERKRAEEERSRQEEQTQRMREANRLKSEFVANMSHELRTPLNAIIGFSELLYDGKAGALNPKQREYMADVVTSSRHMLRLINDVLDLAKVESGRTEFLPESVDVKELVAEVREILRGFTARKRIHIKLDFDPSLKRVLVDPAKLKQVLYNYLSNALKFTPQGGRVTVRVRAEGREHFVLEVEDTGIGIRAEDLHKLFIEFQQLDSSFAKQYPGTGLGLALTKRIVEAQGGEVGVRSTFGKGSMFFARLPRRMVVPASSEAATLSEHPGPRILVIEDEPEDRQWLLRTLIAAGYQVVSARSGAEGLKSLRSERFDAVTLDLVLPDMSGWDLLRRMRAGKLNRDVPVMVVTVLGDQALGAGFAVDDFLEKPTSEDTLLTALEQAGVSGRNATILLVDNDQSSLKLFATALRHKGYKTICRSNAEAALHAAQQVPDVIVMDLAIPGMDGFRFMRRLREMTNGRNIPVIVATAAKLARKEQAALKATTQAIVRKGSQSVKVLIAEVNALIARKAQTAIKSKSRALPSA